MCTVSWQHDAGGFRVTFNRDELRTRTRAHSPEKRTTANGTPYLAPLDPDGGGTWIFLNAHGLCAGLLNTYADDAPADPPRSRGRLLADLADARDCGDLAVRLAHAAVRHRYRPCLVFGIDAAGAVFREWTGRGLRTHTPPLPRLLTTSSVNPARVTAARLACFRRALRGGDGGTLAEDAVRAFHFSHDPADPAESPLMVRGDARTVSVTTVRADADGRGGMEYSEIRDTRPPQPGPVETRILPLRQPAAHA